MKFCSEHWDALRQKIEERGLGDLIAPSGVVAVEQQADQVKRAIELGVTQQMTPANFDPLMSAHWAIATNASQTIADAGGKASALYLLGAGPEDKVEGYGPEHEGKTWPRCPLCYLNLAHEVSCNHNPRCRLDKERGYDWMLDRAADEAKKKAVELGMVT